MATSSSSLRLHLAALAIFAILLVLLSEGLARLLSAPDPISPPPPMVVNATGANPFVKWCRPWCYVNLPGSLFTQRVGELRIPYSINQHGFRGPEIPKKSQRPRLLVVGDSFCEGHGSPWEDAFVQRMEADLAAKGWETVNAGVQGASPIYYAANLPRYQALAPNAVLLVLYDNDLWEDRVYAGMLSHWPRLLRPDRFVGDGRPALHERLRSVLILRRWWRNAFPPPLERLIRTHAQSDTPPPDTSTLGAHLYLAQPGEFQMRWERSQAYLDIFATAWADAGIPLLVVQLSWQFQNPALSKDFPQQAARLEECYAAWTAASGLPFRSLRTSVKSAMQSESYDALAIAGDHHPTPAGHAFLAESITLWVEAHLPNATTNGH